MGADRETARSDASVNLVDLTPLTQKGLMRIINGAMPLAVVSLSFLAILYTLYFASDLFLPIFFAIFLSILLRPIVRTLQRIGIPKMVSSLGVLLGLLGVLVVATVNLSTPAENWLREMPRIQRDIEAKLWPMAKSIEQAKEAGERIQDLTDGKDHSAGGQEVIVRGPSLVNRVFESTWLTLVQLLIVLALTFFFISQDDQKTKQAIRRMPWRNHRETLEEIFNAVQRTVTRYLNISAGIYLSLGLVTTLAMMLLNMPTPYLWGGLAAILGFIPYIGPLVVFGCIACVSLLTFDNWWQIISPPAAYGSISVVEGYILTPSILGRTLTISPINVFLSTLFWTWIWGIPGAFLSVPILVVVTTIAKHLVMFSRDDVHSGTLE